MNVSCGVTLTCNELLLSLPVFINPKATSQTDPFHVPTPEHPQFKLNVAIRRKHAIFARLSGKRPPVQPCGTTFAKGIEQVALPAIDIVSALRPSVNPQDSAMRRGGQRDHHGARASVHGEMQVLNRRSCRTFIGIKREACNGPISPPGQCLSLARYPRGLLLWALFLYPMKQRS